MFCLHREENHAVICCTQRAIDVCTNVLVACDRLLCPKENQKSVWVAFVKTIFLAGLACYEAIPLNACAIWKVQMLLLLLCTVLPS